MRTLRRLWNDEAGFIISSELVLIATILVIGLIAGMAQIRDQVVQELADVGNAFSNLDQSFSFSAITGHTSSTNGSVFLDATDFCDGINEGNASGGDTCMSVNNTPAQGDTP